MFAFARTKCSASQTLASVGMGVRFNRNARSAYVGTCKHPKVHVAGSSPSPALVKLNTLGATTRFRRTAAGGSFGSCPYALEKLAGTKVGGGETRRASTRDEIHA